MTRFWERDAAQTAGGEFSESVEYYDGVRTVRINAIFDNEFAPVEFIDTEVASADPILWIESALVPDIVQGHTIVVRCVTYKVMGVEPDGLGVTKVILSKDAT